MANATNPLGGGNPNSLYVPMSETEQEVLERLTERDDLMVVVHGWGNVHSPKVTFGDLRIAVSFRMEFDRPAVPMGVPWFDLELRTRSGLRLFGPDRLPTAYNGQPFKACAGVFVDMIWDIAVEKMDPKLVKMIKPQAIGLTTREGNQKFTGEAAKLYKLVRTGEAGIRAYDEKKVAKLEAAQVAKRHAPKKKSGPDEG